MSFIFPISFEETVSTDTTVQIDARLSGLFPDNGGPNRLGVCMPSKRWAHIPEDKHPENLFVTFKRRWTPRILIEAFNDKGAPVTPEKGLLKSHNNTLVIDFDNANLQAMRSSVQEALTLFRGEKTAHLGTHLPLTTDTGRFSLKRFGL